MPQFVSCSKLETFSWINDNYKKHAPGQKRKASNRSYYTDIIKKNIKNSSTHKTGAKKSKICGAIIGTCALLLTALGGTAKYNESKPVAVVSFDDIFEYTEKNTDIDFENTEENCELESENIVEDVKIIENDSIKENPDFDFECNLTEEQQSSLDEFVENWNQNKERYQQCEEITGAPAELIAALHWREASGVFDRCLQDGTPLGEPIQSAKYKGKIYNSFEDSVTDVMKDEYFNISKVEKGNYQTYFDFAERYNGTGYRIYHDMNSPYIWAGTDKYTSGKYTGDNEFDANETDKQVGVAVLLKSICE